MKEPGLDGRHRDKDGQIRAKNGNTRIGTIREEYGPGVLPGVSPQAKLETILQRTGAPSLTQLLKPKQPRG